jgi:acyl-CoA reductase-like NAD-dependent aldehyde dehydrogenase
LKRLYVHESQYEEICEEFVSLARNVKVGDGLEEGVELGPIQNAAQFRIVCDLAESAKADGGRFLTGGKPMERDGYFFEPTVVADLTNGSRLVDEEPFGPIVPIIKYTNIDEVIARANANESGLGGSVWSKDLEKASEVGKKLECGSVWINDHGTMQPNAPFGGVKQSGIGVEFGLYGLEEYTSLQMLKIVKR